MFLSHGYKISADPSEESVDHKTYIGIIGSLMYLTESRPYIVFTTGLCARYQAKPKVSHLASVKHIFRYLKGSKALGLLYPAGNDFNLQAFKDVNHVGCRLDRKSTSIGCQFLEEHWLATLHGNKIAFLCLPQKPSMWPQTVVVLKSYGWKPNWWTTDTGYCGYLFTVTQKVI